jgi:hypothetical protein
MSQTICSYEQQHCAQDSYQDWQNKIISQDRLVCKWEGILVVQMESRKRHIKCIVLLTHSLASENQKLFKLCYYHEYHNDWSLKTGGCVWYGTESVRRATRCALIVAIRDELICFETWLLDKFVLSQTGMMVLAFVLVLVLESDFNSIWSQFHLRFISNAF